jgi:hypothetical protein
MNTYTAYFFTDANYASEEIRPIRRNRRSHWLGR